MQEETKKKIEELKKEYDIDNEYLSGINSKEKANDKYKVPKIIERDIVSKMLVACAAIIYIAAIIAGFVTIGNFLIAIYVWTGGFITGTLFLGVSQIINYLQIISMK